MNVAQTLLEKKMDGKVFTRQLPEEKRSNLYEKQIFSIRTRQMLMLRDGGRPDLQN